mmetsp:Transcript_55313/g.160265  ORF Transcript_55313/g.160265 Transcript_55313/m.160265 type:complete len:579 (+) Transcript_55313:82-1818(+)
MVVFPAPPGADGGRENLTDPRGGRAGCVASKQRCRQCELTTEQLLSNIADLEERLQCAHTVAARAEARAESDRAAVTKLREALDQEIAESREALVMSQSELYDAVKKHETEVSALREELATSQATARDLEAAVRELHEAGVAAQVAREGEPSARLQEECDQLRSELNWLQGELNLRPKREEWDCLRTELDAMRAELKTRMPAQESDQLRSEVLKLRLELKQRPTSEDAAKLRAELQQQRQALDNFREVESRIEQLAVELQASQARERQAQVALAKMGDGFASTRSEAMAEGSKCLEKRTLANRQAAIAVHDEANNWTCKLVSLQKRELRMQEEMLRLREELRLLAGLSGSCAASTTNGGSPGTSTIWNPGSASSTTFDASPAKSMVEMPVVARIDQEQVVSPSSAVSPRALVFWRQDRAQSAVRPVRRVSSCSRETVPAANVPGVQMWAPKPTPAQIAPSPDGKSPSLPRSASTPRPAAAGSAACAHFSAQTSPLVARRPLQVPMKTMTIPRGETPPCRFMASSDGAPVMRQAPPPPPSQFGAASMAACLASRGGGPQMRCGSREPPEARMMPLTMRL